MSELSKAARPAVPTAGLPCGGPDFDRNETRCPDVAVGWRWCYYVAEWLPACESHFYRRGVSGVRHRLLNKELVA